MPETRKNIQYIYTSETEILRKKITSHKLRKLIVQISGNEEGILENTGRWLNDHSKLIVKIVEESGNLLPALVIGPKATKAEVNKILPKVFLWRKKIFNIYQPQYELDSFKSLSTNMKNDGITYDQIAQMWNQMLKSLLKKGRESKDVRWILNDTFHIPEEEVRSIIDAGPECIMRNYPITQEMVRETVRYWKKKKGFLLESL